MAWTATGDTVIRRWLLAAGAAGLVLGALFAAYPLIDIEIARMFFDGGAERFPIAHSKDWLHIRQNLNWIPLVFVLPAFFVLLRKIVFPGSPMLIAPSVVLFLIGSFIAAPGIATNVVLKENWGRPRPHHVQQFAGTSGFEPWWRPGGTCPRNCSFVSGEASQAYWLVAPAMLTPAPVRPAAMGAAVVFGTSVGALRVAFGRHFASDIVFAAVITIAIVIGFYWLLLDPIRRNDARLERVIARRSIALHRLACGMLAGTGNALTGAGRALERTGQHWRQHIADLQQTHAYARWTPANAHPSHLRGCGHWLGSPDGSGATMMPVHLPWRTLRNCAPLRAPATAPKFADTP